MHGVINQEWRKEYDIYSSYSSVAKVTNDNDDDIFVNCSRVVTRWQKYSTHLHTNNI